MDIIYTIELNKRNTSQEFKTLEWIKLSLIQTAKWNLDSTIHLLSNIEIPIKLPNLIQYDINQFAVEEIKCFEQHYTHLNTTPVDFEIFCFKRWMILKEFLHKYNINSNAYYGDLDNVIFANLRQLYQYYKKYGVTISHYHCGGNMFISDIKFIGDLSENILNTYLQNEKQYFPLYEYYKKRNYKRGGICDMTFINEMLLSKQYPNVLGDISIQSHINKGGSFDNNIIFLDNDKWESEIKLGQKIKKIYKYNDQVFCRYNEAMVRFNNIHFFSNFKNIIKEYV